MFPKVDFGVFGLFLATLFICGEIINLKLDQAIIIAKDKDAHSTFWSGIWIGFVFSGLFYMSVFFIPVKIPKLLTSFGLLFWSWNQMFGSIMLRNNAYKQIALSRILQVMVSAVVTISFGKLNLKNGLIFGFFSGYFVQNLYFLFSPYIQTHLERIEWSTWKNIKTHAPFTLYGTVSSLINVIGKYIPIVFIKNFFGLSMAGDFSLTQRTLQAPVGIITGAMGKAFYQQSATIEHKKSQSDHQKLIIETTKFLFLTGIIPTILLTLAGGTLFYMFFGKTWGDAGNMAAILAPMFFASYVVGPISMFLDVKKELKWEFYFNLVQTIVKLIVLYFCCRNLDIFTVLKCWSIVQVFFYIILWWKVYNLSK